MYIKVGYTEPKEFWSPMWRLSFEIIDLGRQYGKNKSVGDCIGPHFMPCVLLTDHAPSDKVSPIASQRGHAPETSAPFLTPTCAYKETPSTKSHLTTAINNTLVALHTSYTITYKNTSIRKTRPCRNTSVYACQNKDYKLRCGSQEHCTQKRCGKFMPIERRFTFIRKYKPTLKVQ